MRPGRYIQRTLGGWASVEVKRGQRHERLLDSFTGPGSKARAIQDAGTNQVLPRAEDRPKPPTEVQPVDLSGVQAVSA